MRKRKYLVIAIVLLLGIRFLAHRKIEVAFSTVHASDTDRMAEAPRRKVTRIPRLLDDGPVLTKSKDPALGSNVDPMTPEQLQILCQLRSLRIQVPISGEIQAIPLHMNGYFGNANNNVVWIKSVECPEGKYSIVSFTEGGELTSELDCRTVNWTELSSMSGEQGSIEDVAPSETIRNFAVAGAGYFVLQCPDTHLVLTRDGHFNKNSVGQSSNENGCILLNASGLPFAGSAIKRSGCTNSGECLATLDPSTDPITNLDYINSFSFRADAAVLPSQSVTKKSAEALHPIFFMNALENISSPDRGATSVSWVGRPSIDLMRLDCK